MGLCLISLRDFFAQHTAWHKGGAQEMLKEKDSQVFLKQFLVERALSPHLLASRIFAELQTGQGSII